MSKEGAEEVYNRCRRGAEEVLKRCRIVLPGRLRMHQGSLYKRVYGYFSFIVGTQNEPQIMAGCTKTIPCPLASAGAALSWEAPVPGAVQLLLLPLPLPLPPPPRCCRRQPAH